MAKLTQFVLIAVFGILFCFAQVNRGTLTGLITDPSGAVVPGVKVTATHVETGTPSSTVASESGSYTIPTLQIGLYRIEFEVPSFKMGGYVQDDWRVRPNLTINFGLRYEYTMPIHGGAFVGLKSWEDLSTGKLDGFANLDPTVPNPKAGNLPGAMVFSGSRTGRLQGDVFRSSRASTSTRTSRNMIIGGWTLSSFLSYESGTPDTVASGSSPIGTGSRVFITSYEVWRAPVSGEKFDPNKDLWYNKSAFNQGISQAMLDSMFGNATRNNPKLRTPWNFNENVALGRSFRFGERRSFDIRGETFNVLNRVRWVGANNGITSASFGRVTTQVNTPRRMQIGMKLFF